MLVILLQDWVISVMSILPLPISTIEDKDATDYTNCYVDETDDENVTDDESNKLMINVPYLLMAVKMMKLMMMMMMMMMIIMMMMSNDCL